MKPKYRFFICDRCGKAALETTGTLQEEMSLHRTCAKRILQIVDPESTLGIDQPIHRRKKEESITIKEAGTFVSSHPRALQYEEINLEEGDKKDAKIC